MKGIRKYGFKCGYTDIFAGDSTDSEKRNEEEVVLFNEEKGLIIYAHTFCGKRMSKAVIYGQIPQSLQDMTAGQKNFFINHSICIKSNKSGIAFEMRVSKDFESFMKKLLEDFTFLPQWEDGITPDFLNYVERRGNSISRENIKKEKLSGCAPEIKRIIA